MRALPHCGWNWRPGRARRELETRIACLEQMAGETLCTAGYLAHYYNPD